MNESTEPETAVQMYLNEREGEVRPSTLQSHEYRLQHLLRWCDEQDIDDVGQLTGRLLHEYRLWRRDDGDLSPASVKGQMDTLRVFVRFCERIEAVDGDLAEKIHSPTLEGSDAAREAILSTEDATPLLEHLNRYRYASRAHVVLHLFWSTGVRLGTLRSFDVEDYDGENGRIKATHDGRTALKNGDGGSRFIALRPETAELVEDWIDANRHDVTGPDGRRPLVTTRNGRISKNALRYAVYRVTRPCVYGQPCPHGEEPEECNAARNDKKQASKCPSSVSPHAVRRGSITHHLSDDVPEKVVSDRCDVSQDVLSKHYDSRTEERKVEQRREYL